MKSPIEITYTYTQFDELITEETNKVVARMGYDIKFNKDELVEMLKLYLNPPLDIHELKLFINKPIFNNMRKEWYLLLAVRNGANKEIDVIGTKKQYVETFGWREGCFYAREVKA